ncbi:DAPG hydrolase family protein [Lacrimispora sp.]|uniref:DAPG hydrolase family protein n=1 Tax=Lacrimispora sp. TaxID=2719234 RepID=UPI0028A8410E|nr:hypothetical protein [Lacrimispora sp.]
MACVYSTGKVMVSPRTCGKKMNECTMEDLRSMTAALTKEESQSVYAKYYKEPLADIQPEHVRAIEHGTLNPDECYMPELAGGVLLDGDSKYRDNGYGVLPNGVGFAAIKIAQDVTNEMIRDYQENFANDKNCNLFYKTWYPGAHLIHFEDGAVEDFGWGMMRMEMNWNNFRFEHLGIHEEDISKRDPHCIFLMGLGGKAEEINEAQTRERVMCMVQHTRETATGRELKVHYWNGMTFQEDGTLICKPEPDRDKTMREMKLMMIHCMTEYCNQVKLIKEFWNRKT